MDVYRQAASILRKVRENQGTAKGLCLQKTVQKKKQTYAVVCETLLHSDLLNDVLKTSGFLSSHPKFDPDLTLVLCYDALVGRGVRTKQHYIACEVNKNIKKLKEAYNKVHGKYKIIRKRDVDKSFDADATEGSKKTTKSGVSDGQDILCKYTRINTLLTDIISVQDILDRSAVKKAKLEICDPEGVAPTAEQEQSIAERVKELREYTIDPQIPNLLCFPPNSNIRAHPLVKYGKLIIQDKASCIPPCVLLDKIEVVRNNTAVSSNTPIQYIIDACAAPGNKTTELAALGKELGVKIMAIEKDSTRCEILSKRITQLGAAEYINVVNMDFFDLSSQDREAAEAILLDPSCSSSGVVSRVDLMVKKRNADAQVEERSDNRVEKLAGLQRKMLVHSLLSFKNVRRVVYSTCSINVQENEDVVRLALEDTRVQAQGWGLSNIMPSSWSTRGIKQDTDVFPLDFTIRCDPTLDKTNGFFVACFDR